MSVRVTIDIPDALHDCLRRQAQKSGISIDALIGDMIQGALDSSYVIGPLVHVKGELGPAFPRDENPHDLAFDDSLFE